MQPSPALRRALWLALLLATLSEEVGCHGPAGRVQLITTARRDSQSLGIPEVPDYEGCRDRSNVVETYDTNGDARFDLVHVKSPRGDIVCRGTDTNYDGTVDSWTAFDQGKITAIAVAPRGDGRVSTLERYEDGKLRKRTVDANGDGRPDQVWTFDPERPQCPVIRADADGEGFDVCQSFAPSLRGGAALPDSGARAPASSLSATAPAAAAGPTCTRFWGEARYAALAYTHVVHIANSCSTAADCVITTDVTPAPKKVSVAPGTAVEAVSVVGSPAGTFTPSVTCSLRVK